MDFFAVNVVSTGPMLLLVGILLCSLLCLAVAFYNGGELLERQWVLLLCELYLVLAALVQLKSAGAAMIPQIMGFLVLALGILPVFFRKTNFDMARYSVALGATLAACALLLF